MEAQKLSCVSLFQSAPSRGGRYDAPQYQSHLMSFNPRPRVEGDGINTTLLKGIYERFQSAALAWRRYSLLLHLPQIEVFQSAALAWRSDKARLGGAWACRRFNPRALAWRAILMSPLMIIKFGKFQSAPPRVEGDFRAPFDSWRAQVSIRALAWRAISTPTTVLWPPPGFNPRPRVEGDRRLR